ncbi:hypothetical protein J6590_103590 [Homalodisca vitripennis]|nr:hypothetical protein J6590_103590 [Homalodisca vitripennis]
MARNSRRVEEGTCKSWGFSTKGQVPPFLKRLFKSLKKENVIAGFKKCQKVLEMLPFAKSNDSTSNPEESQQLAQALAPVAGPSTAPPHHLLRVDYQKKKKDGCIYSEEQNSDEFSRWFEGKSYVRAKFSVSSTSRSGLEFRIPYQ